MQKINLRELYPDVYKTDVFVDVAEEVLAVIRGQEQDDAAYERRKFRHANSHFPRPAGPHFPASQGHIKRSALEIGRARGAPPC